MQPVPEVGCRLTGEPVRRGRLGEVGREGVVRTDELVGLRWAGGAWGRLAVGVLVVGHG